MRPAEESEVHRRSTFCTQSQPFLVSEQIVIVSWETTWPTVRSFTGAIYHHEIRGDSLYVPDICPGHVTASKCTFLEWGPRRQPNHDLSLTPSSLSWPTVDLYFITGISQFVHWVVSSWLYSKLWTSHWTVTWSVAQIPVAWGWGERYVGVCRVTQSREGPSLKQFFFVIIFGPFFSPLSCQSHLGQHRW